MTSLCQLGDWAQTAADRRLNCLTVAGTGIRCEFWKSPHNLHRDVYMWHQRLLVLSGIDPHSELAFDRVCLLEEIRTQVCVNLSKFIACFEDVVCHSSSWHLAFLPVLAGSHSTAVLVRGHITATESNAKNKVSSGNLCVVNQPFWPWASPVPGLPTNYIQYAETCAEAGNLPAPQSSGQSSTFATFSCGWITLVRVHVLETGGGCSWWLWLGTYTNDKYKIPTLKSAALQQLGLAESFPLVARSISKVCISSGTELWQQIQNLGRS